MNERRDGRGDVRFRVRPDFGMTEDSLLGDVGTALGGHCILLRLELGVVDVIIVVS